MSFISKTGFGLALFLAASPLAANAADMPVYKDYVEKPKVYAKGGWYLRGYIGMTNQHVDELDNVLFDDPAVFEWLDEGDFDAGVLYGGGIGYQFNDWLRVDLTGEYRGKTDFSAFDRYDTDGDGTFDGTNDYDGKKSELLFLANVYADVGHWHGVTPYVGAGIGASRNTIHGFRDVNVPNAGVAYADDESTWNFAWALHAGLGYELTKNATLDFGYSFVYLGDAKTGDIIASDGTNVIDNPMDFNDITSHDFKVGLRYAFY